MANSDGMLPPTMARRGTLIRDMANCPKLRNVEYPPMIFPEVEDVASPASVLDTAGLISPMPAPTRIIVARATGTDGFSMSIIIPTPDTANPTAMMKNGRTTATILLYKSDTVEFVMPWMPRNRPTVDAATCPGSSGSSRNVGILVGRRNAIVMQMNIAA